MDRPRFPIKERKGEFESVKGGGRGQYGLRRGQSIS